jgi:hypothetical protein
VKPVAVMYESSDSEAPESLQTIQSMYRPNTIIVASSDPPFEDAPTLRLDRPLNDNKPRKFIVKYVREYQSSPREHHERFAWMRVKDKDMADFVY